MSKGVISSPIKWFFSNFSILAKLLLAKKCPKWGIRIPNAGDDNQGCRILTVILNRIDWLWVMKYNLYSINLLYTNESISTSLWGCDTLTCQSNYVRQPPDMDLHYTSTSLSTSSILAYLPLLRSLWELFLHHDPVHRNVIYPTRAPPLALAFLRCYVFPIWFSFPKFDSAFLVILNFSNLIRLQLYVFILDSSRIIRVTLQSNFRKSQLD